MFTEILKIIPKLDGAALSEMEQSLGSRFSRLAKRFGSGLKAAIMGGGVAALAIGIIDRVLNPLKETQESMDRILAKADDINTFADQFNTTTGNLYKLQLLAKTKGVDEQQLNTLLLKYQTAITQARANPGDPSSVKNFVNDQDIAESFFKFIQGMQTLTKAQQDFVQREVFGEKLIGKASEFLNAKDLPKIGDMIGPADQFTAKLKKGGEISDQKDLWKTLIESKGFMDQIGKVNTGMVADQLFGDQQKMNQETKRLDNYNALKDMQNRADKLQFTLEDAFSKLIPYIPKITDALTDLAKSRVVRDALGVGKKGN